MATTKTTKKARKVALDALAASLNAGVAPVKKRTAAEKFVNNTSRLRKWICACEVHVVDEETGAEKPGPYIIRCAGTGMLAECAYCKTYFVLEDEAARRRLYRGCDHCTNPEAHAHDHDPGCVNVDDHDPNHTRCPLATVEVA